MKDYGDVQPEEDDVGALHYHNGFRIALEDFGIVPHQIGAWHGGQWSPEYALMSGDYSPNTITGAFYSVEKAIGKAHEDDVEDDDYSMLETLEQWSNGVKDLVS